jgi:hypothetical protein
MTALRWRACAAIVLSTLLVGKFLLFGQIDRIPANMMNANLMGLLIAAGAENINSQGRRDQTGASQSQFKMKECAEPYVAIQALYQEDLQAVVDNAVNLPKELKPHIIYLGEELDFGDQFGVKLTAVKQLVLYRLGLSPVMPSLYLYIVLAKDGCTTYRQLNWSSVWAS